MHYLDNAGADSFRRLVDQMPTLLDLAQRHNTGVAAATEQSFSAAGAHAMELFIRAFVHLKRPGRGLPRDFQKFTRILDMPCGDGLMARHLRATFPDAELVVADSTPEAVDSCVSQYRAVPWLIEGRSYKEAAFGSLFEAIWSGSLTETYTLEQLPDLIEFCARFLKVRGVAVVAARLSSGEALPFLRDRISAIPALRLISAESGAWASQDVVTLQKVG